ncbi:23S rRNA (uracil(1939)-C(5))-methyltransferase RlmD [Francisella adeliensis]|uniref:23S rRNA (uracil(1939)-C(5))-methyltransferase RlmD n=1 Tax=Francisella adeliensis TaxID=2007306 RepID=A0A2Z4XZE0_9GAMM|nr:23S rRNA (uracil(1939)-C(5))-methyltransferase RlmD [Francisella adeliensis]AXA34018.1 23S rRNA (uracil(1939)-C(5))-methyltransferase [Francisella adeliensis]MBK2084712.1 23S rRNA (uracil(1939)-C(5))-methyltransferase RlmD [Francisella adeliensis]MBK2096065.1 23S rRNA (uracil(1939)-C(5))-methyltransferase RlmD [Francisella adeliensis]QIW12255.1 23S rRNA (uracil(1939)-C(5))-methyltransferase RlmD [Francisella adeliensis]QIW14850.1 23S rRNA (uracil(1939)-C(5))-methyltransferase RlmD [Francise
MGRSRRNKLKEGIFEAQIISLSHDGRGIAKVDGKTTFIPFTLPGEEVKFEYTFSKAKFDEGKVVEYISKSAERVEPICEHFEICGGCSLQHMSSQAQIKLKQETLLNQLKYIGEGVEPQSILEPLLSQNTEGYRNKARLGVRFVTKKGRILVGFRERNGRFLADIEKCVILNPLIGQKLPEISAFIENLSNYKQIAQLEVAIDDYRPAIIIRHLEPFTDSDIELIKQFSQEHNYWIYLQSKGPDTVFRLYPEQNVEPVKLSYNPVKDIKIGFEPGDFTQVNNDINKKMIQKAIELLDIQKDDSIIDLFCGLGNFTLPLSQFAKTVIGVEGEQTMVNRAIETAKNNNVKNAKFYMANLFESFEDKEWFNDFEYNKMLLDPPRAGAQEVCQNIEKFGVERIVYVSCSTATLARDAGILVNQKGYTLVSTGVMDMFPHTMHVESIAVFVKNKK